MSPGFWADVRGSHSRISGDTGVGVNQLTSGGGSLCTREEGGLHGVLREGTGRSGRLLCLVQGGRKSRRGSSGCSGRGQNADSPESSTLIYRPQPRQRHLLCSEEGAAGTGTALSPESTRGHTGTEPVFTLSEAPNPLRNRTLIVRCRVLPQFPHC